MSNGRVFPAAIELFVCSSSSLDLPEPCDFKLDHPARASDGEREGGGSEGSFSSLSIGLSLPCYVREWIWAGGTEMRIVG
jgi:hypothetical protein